MTEEWITTLAKIIQKEMGCTWLVALKMVPGAAAPYQEGRIGDYLLAYKNAQIVQANPQRTTAEDARLMRVEKEYPTYHFRKKVAK